MTRPNRARALASRRQPRRRSLVVEILEDRRMLAATDLALLTDINPAGGLSAPAELTAIGNTLYFSAASNGTNRELWKVSAAGGPATLVKEIRAGSASSAPLQLTNVNGTLYFTADDGTNGRELWKSDGTDIGTVMVTNINAAGASFQSTVSTVTDFAHIGNTVFFRANDGTHGYELYRSNGALGDAVRISDVNAGTGNSNPSNLTMLGTSLYFTAVDGASDTQLWKTDAAGDATTAPPAIVKNINSTGNDGVNFVTAFNNNLYFQADDGTHGAELWKSDGTIGNADLFKDIRAIGSPSSSLPNQLTVVGNKLFFTAIDQGSNREVYVTDGTAAGTTKVKEITAGLTGSSPTNLTAVGNTLYFLATETTTAELWKSDGADAGTVRPRTDHGPANPSLLTNVGGVLYLTGATTAEGVEPWTSDGTNAGTHIVKDLELGTISSNPTEFASLLGRLVLAATTTAAGSEVWHETPASYGDFNLDQATDGADFLKWQSLLGSADASTDANHNGVVDGADLPPWSSNFGYSAASAASSVSTTSAQTATAATTSTFASGAFISADMFAAVRAPSQATSQEDVAAETRAAQDAAFAALADAPPTSSASLSYDAPVAAGDANNVAQDLASDWADLASAAVDAAI